MKLLEAINVCLRGNGDQQVNEPDELNAAAAFAAGVVTRKRIEMLSNGYDFNTDTIDLIPSSDGNVRVNRSFLVHRWPHSLTYRVDPDNASKWIVWNKNNNAYQTEKVTNFKVVFEITDYENLPDTFGRWVAYEAAIEYFSEVNPNSAIPARLLDDRRRAHTRFMMEHPASNLGDLSGFTRLRNV